MPWASLGLCLHRQWLFKKPHKQQQNVTLRATGPLHRQQDRRENWTTTLELRALSSVSSREL